MSLHSNTETESGLFVLRYTSTMNSTPCQNNLTLRYNKQSQAIKSFHISAVILFVPVERILSSSGFRHLFSPLIQGAQDFLNGFNFEFIKIVNKVKTLSDNEQKAVPNVLDELNSLENGKLQTNKFYQESSTDFFLHLS